MGRSTAGVIERVETKAYRIPTEEPESDGTYVWDATILVTVHLWGAGETGFGYTYAHESAAVLIREKLAEVVTGSDPMDIPRCWHALIHALRNLGSSGIGMMAVSAIDAALYDLKARLLRIPLAALLGAARHRVPVYGSGGFTSYTTKQLQKQLAGWISAGIPRVKMKIGTDAAADPGRVRSAREAVGPAAELYVDANGAYGRKQAVAMAEKLAPLGVSWYEEPVVHHDREGLRQVREHAPAEMEVAAGEYGFHHSDFRQLIRENAVDVLQADVTRCGITGFRQAATLCETEQIQLSSHCAPSLHLHPCCAAQSVRHMEYFHDHVRIERMLFDGAREPVEGVLSPDMGRPGHGLEFKEADARRYEL